MGTISNASAIIGLKATGTPTKTNVTGSSTIGLTQSSIPLSDADIAYSFKVTSSSDAEEDATLTISTGDVAQTTGTPIIEDAGVDFEGDDLATMVTPEFILITTPSTNAAVVTVQSSAAANPTKNMNAGEYILTTLGSTVGTILFGFGEETGDSFEVTIIGKST